MLPEYPSRAEFAYALKHGVSADEIVAAINRNNGSNAISLLPESLTVEFTVNAKSVRLSVNGHAYRAKSSCDVWQHAYYVAFKGFGYSSAASADFAMETVKRFKIARPAVPGTVFAWTIPVTVDIPR